MQLYIDPLPRFESLLAQYGMQINKDLVVSADPAKINLRSTSMPVQTVPSQDLSPNAPSVVLSEMSSIRLLENSGIQAQELLRTHEACYLKELSSGLDNLRQDAEDAAGSFLVGAYAQKESSRLVLVTGNSLISNRGLAHSGQQEPSKPGAGVSEPGRKRPEHPCQIPFRGGGFPFFSHKGHIGAAGICCNPLAAHLPGRAALLQKKTARALKKGACKANAGALFISLSPFLSAKQKIVTQFLNICFKKYINLAQ